MIVVPVDLTLADYIAARLRPRDREEALSLREDDDLGAWVKEALAVPGEIFVACGKDGEPIVMGGFWRTRASYLVRPWIVATDQIATIGDGLTRFAIRMHRALAKDGVRRFETLCLGDAQGINEDSTARRWLARLGYQIEGVHPQMGKGGQTMVTMARVEVAHG